MNLETKKAVNIAMKVSKNILYNLPEVHGIEIADFQNPNKIQVNVYTQFGDHIDKRSFSKILKATSDLTDGRIVYHQYATVIDKYTKKN